MRKKLLSLFLSLCMVLSVLPAFSESAAGYDWEALFNAISAETQSQEAAMDDETAAELAKELESLFGSYLGDAENADAYIGGDAILSMLLASAANGDPGLDLVLADVIDLFATPIEAPKDAVAAESKEKFFGTWKLSSIDRGDTVISADAMTKEEKDLALTLSENTLSINVAAGDNSAAVTTELAGGALNLIVGNKIMKVYLSGAGELKFGMNNATVCLVPGTADAVLPLPLVETVDEESEAAMLDSLLASLGLSGEDGDSGLDLKSLLNGDGEEGEGFGGMLSGLLGSLSAGVGEDGEGLGGMLSGLLGSLSAGVGEDGEGLGGMLSGLLGSLTSGEGEISGGEQIDLSALLGLFGEEAADLIDLPADEAALDALVAAEWALMLIDKPEEAIAAESKDQFFGTWRLYSLSLEGVEIPANSMDDTASPFIVTLSEDTFQLLDGDTETTTKIKSELVDGALVVSSNENLANFYLLKNGNLVFGYESMILTLVPVPAEK